jgi:predicted nucleotide-binding protein (sugar kinase/HSP70/actin superfamily)
MLCNWLDEKALAKLQVIYLNAQKLYVIVGEFQVKILNHVLLAQSKSDIFLGLIFKSLNLVSNVENFFNCQDNQPA